MKQHSEYQAMRDKQREREQIEILEELRQEDRLRCSPDKTIREMTDSELEEYWCRMQFEVMKVEAEMARRGLE